MAAADVEMKAPEVEADAEMKPAEEKPEEPKAPEPPKEHEEDAKALSGEKVKGADFLVPDTTLNVMRSDHGNGLLMSLQDHGLQFLMAGARASVGIKSGRYMFEVRIVECASPSDSWYPKHLLKIGFSTKDSSLLFDQEDGMSAYFDSEGHFGEKSKQSKLSQKCWQSSVVSCLLNLEKGHENCNTISVFRDGKRISDPQPLPESLHGETLFPTVNFKCMTLQTNFGPEPMCELPFKCHMVGGAAKKDAEVSTHTPPSKPEVMFPVSLPDEGSFDWLEMWLAKNPGYVELSERSIRSWLEKSGLWSRKDPNASNDRPAMNFGVPKLDDGFSVKKMLRSLAAMQKRNYVVMEVKGNLIKEERELLLKAFEGHGFKITATVLVGDPPAAFKKRAQELLLATKQEASDKEHKKAQAEIRRKWEAAKRAKEIEKKRKADAKAKEKEAKEKAKALEEAKKKALEEAKEGGEAAAEPEKKEGEEEAKEPEKEEAEEEPEEPEEEDEPEPVEEDPPKAELSDEEKKLSFRPVTVPDLTTYVQNTSFTKFSVPEKSEGFADIKYEFLKDAAKAKKFMEEWIANKKLTTRVEDITPSQWFFGIKKEWDKSVSEWHQALNKYRSSVAQKKAAKVAKEQKKKQAAAKAAAAKAKAEADAKAKEEAKAKAKAEAEAKGEEYKEEDEEMKPAEEPVVEEEPEEDEEEEEPDIDFYSLDVFGLDDVKDVEGGVPLFKEWTNDDWALLSLGFELHLLGHAFRKDVTDKDRAGMHVDHLDFYFNKYYKKQLNPKNYSMEAVKDVVELVKDIVYIDSKGVLQTMLPEEMESYQVFAKVTEEVRKLRLLQIDLGNESAVLKISGQAYHQGGGNKGQKRKGDWGDSAGKGGWGQGWGGSMQPAPVGKKGCKGWGK